MRQELHDSQAVLRQAEHCQREGADQSRPLAKRVPALGSAAGSFTRAVVFIAREHSCWQHVFAVDFDLTLSGRFT